MDMHAIRGLVLCLFLAMSLSSCVAASEKEKPKVHCPACGTDFDALFQKRF